MVQSDHLPSNPRNGLHNEERINGSNASLAGRPTVVISALFVVAIAAKRSRRGMFSNTENETF